MKLLSPFIIFVGIVSIIILPIQARALPSSVTVAGSLQSELGCPGDWQPDCASTYLVYDGSDKVWQETFTIPAGSWEYKAALNNSWDENRFFMDNLSVFMGLTTVLFLWQWVTTTALTTHYTLGEDAGILPLKH